MARSGMRSAKAYSKAAVGRAGAAMSPASTGCVMCQCGTARPSRAHVPPVANRAADARAIVTRGTSIGVPKGFTGRDCTFAAPRPVRGGAYARTDAGLPAGPAPHFPPRRAHVPGHGDRHGDGHGQGAHDV